MKRLRFLFIFFFTITVFSNSAETSSSLYCGTLKTSCNHRYQDSAVIKTYPNKKIVLTRKVAEGGSATALTFVGKLKDLTAILTYTEKLSRKFDRKHPKGTIKLRLECKNSKKLEGCKVDFKPSDSTMFRGYPNWWFKRKLHCNKKELNQIHSCK